MLRAIADKMEGVSLTIGAKTSSTGTIFGSVTNIQIAEALNEKGFEIDRKLIQIKDQVKEVGKYTAKLLNYIKRCLLKFHSKWWQSNSRTI